MRGRPEWSRPVNLRQLALCLGGRKLIWPKNLASRNLLWPASNLWTANLEGANTPPRNFERQSKPLELNSSTRTVAASVCAFASDQKRNRETDPRSAQRLYFPANDGLAPNRPSVVRVRTERSRPLVSELEAWLQK